MTSSGTYAFNPSLGELVLYAFNLCGVRNTSLTQEHMVSARVASNLMLADWSNDGPNLWKVDLVTTPLVAGTATYAVDAKTIAILDAYVSQDDGVSPPVDRIILPISRSEYASYPNKTQQGTSSVFWFDRLLAPTITLYQVPDAVTYNYLKYYRFVQVQDAGFTAGQTLDIPYRWMKAFADGLALELARSWAPQLVTGLAPFAVASYAKATKQDVETSNFYISPQLAGYYRN